MTDNHSNRSKKFILFSWLILFGFAISTAYTNCANVDFSGPLDASSLGGDFSGDSGNSTDQRFVVNEDEVLEAIVDFEKLNREIGGIDKSSLNITILSNPTNGVVTNLVASTGTFTYTPKANYNGSDSFTVQVLGYSNRLKKNFTASRTIQITILPINDAPNILTPAGLIATITAGTNASFIVSANDIDGDTLTYLISQKDSGTFTYSGDGKYTFTPSSCSFTGDVNFKIRVTDSSGLMDEKSYVIKVNANSGTLNIVRTINEDMPFTESLLPLFITCDPIAAGQSISVGTPAPTKGTLSNLIPADLKFTYAPNANANGAETIYLNVNVSGIAKTIKIDLIINPVNDKPTMTPLSHNVMRNSSITFSPTFRDIENDPVILKLNLINAAKVTTTLGGELTKLSETSFKYQAPLGIANQTDSLKVYLNDTHEDAEVTLQFIITANPIVDLQPALAVRGLSCTICHAQINSSVISDFGKTGAGSDLITSAAYWEHKAWDVVDSRDLDSPLTAAQVDSARSVGSAMAFESSKITGNFFVPAGVTAINAQYPTATLISSILSAYKYRQTGIASIPLSDYNYAALGLSTPQTTYYQGPLTAPGTLSVSSWASVQTKSTIYIGAPSATDIISAMANKNANFEVQGMVSGMALATAAEYGHEYFTNSSLDVTCNGDLIIKKDVVLNNIRITTKSGCRIYSTGAIFVQGNLNVVQENGGTLANVQLVSSIAVVMGLDYEGLALRREMVRVHQDGPSNNINAKLATRLDPTGDTTFDYIYNSASKLRSVVKDATQYNSRNIAFNKLLINAPVVHSRYTGNISGVIIAEVTLMSPGNFSYSFDPVFSNANIEILPILDGRKVLRVE